MLQAEQILQNRYQLQRLLGRTGAGRQTWLAEDLQLSTPVVVKLLAFSPQMQWEELKLFEREAQVLQTLNHPRIPHYRDYFSLERETGGGLPWFALVQDYIPGKTFQEILENGQVFSEKQAHKIAEQVLKILCYLHELNPPFLHRDIKPSNLIWGTDEQVYLVDFGAVQDQIAVTGMTFTVVGTCGYAPLEQFWGRAVPASDLYALGATLIHLVSGMNPTDLPQKENRIQFTEFTKLSPKFGRWIETLTAPAVGERFSSARQALQALESGLNFPDQSQLLPHDSRLSQSASQRIKIHKSRERLDIGFWGGKVRKGGFEGALAWLITRLLLTTIIWSLLSLLLWGSGMGEPSDAATLIYLLMVMGSFILVLARFLFSLNLWTQVIFNGKELQLRHKFLIFKWLNQKKQFQRILGVFVKKMGETMKFQFSPNKIAIKSV